MMMSNSERASDATVLSWFLIVVGVVTLGVGVFFVASPHETLKVFTVIGGILLLIDGLLAIIAALVGVSESRGLLAMVGVLSVIAGVVLIIRGALFVYAGWLARKLSRDAGSGSATPAFT